MTMREKLSTNGLKRKVLAGILLVVLAFSVVSCAKESGEISDADQIVNGIQLAEGYGIFSAGQLPVYIMKEEPAAIETEGAKAWLVSSVYHDGIFGYLVRLEDYSITEIPQEEAKQLLKQQEENTGALEKEDRELRHLDFFPIDSEKGIYGRSSFEIRAGYRSSAEGAAGEYQKDHFTNTITGAGIPQGSFRANQTMCKRQYGEYLDNGFVTTLFGYYSNQVKFDTSGPRGSYQIKIPGFTDGFTVEYIKADVYPCVEDIPGRVIKEGAGLMAVGEWTEEGLKVTPYTTRGVSPEISGLSCEADGKTGYGIRTYTQDNMNLYMASPEFNSRMELWAGTPYCFEIPEQFKQGEIFLECSKISLATSEQSGWLHIPIVQEQTKLDLEAELEDCIIRITSVEKEEEPWPAGILGENEAEDRRPTVWLKTDVALKGNRFLRLRYIRAAQEEEDPLNPYRDRWGKCSYVTSRLAGIHAFYEEGEEEIRLRFEKPVYDWYEKFRLPVQVKGQTGEIK